MGLGGLGSNLVNKTRRVPESEPVEPEERNKARVQKVTKHQGHNMAVNNVVPGAMASMQEF